MSIAGKYLVLRATRAVRTAAADRRRAVRRDLSGFVSAADCADLLATLDRYPDADTQDLRDVLALRRSPADARRIQPWAPSHPR